MNLYEANYFLLRCLISNLMELSRGGVSSVLTGQDLYLQVIERTKYTISIKLTHMFQDQGQPVISPGLRIRIYFDAGQAEVLSWQGKGSFSGIDPGAYSTLASVKAKWQVNLFLGKWLQYCLDIGHQFDAQHLHNTKELTLAELG